MSQRRRERPAPALSPAPFPWPWAVFAAALAVRILYWRATDDSSWPHTAAFKGDALLWIEFARSLRAGLPFELGLPVHPPGTAYLVAALWGGSGGFALLKLAWCVLGAAAAALFAAAMARAFGPTVGALAGAWMAGSTGLLILSVSLNGETPYLALVALGFWLLPAPDVRSLPRVSAWAAVNAVACLFRVEHLLFVLLVLALIAARSCRLGSARRAAAAVAVSVAAFVLPLVPWHWSAWRALERFNEQPAETPAPVRGLLNQLAGIRWDPAARARLEALPAFARDHSEAFVAATVAYRGGTRVRDEDFAILQQAFGVEARRLRRRPFVSLYGPLNFALASHPASGTGFGHAGLDAPPPLGGGAAAYPPMLVGGLPPRELAFIYPPHLALVNDGFEIGWGWLAADPERALRRGMARLARFWAGAASAVTGYALPVGASGTRYAVDMTVSDGGPAVAWRVVVLAAALAGLAAGWRRPALHPWLFLLLTKAIAAAMFFGYARLGATAIPVVALLAALAAERWLRDGARHRIQSGLRMALVVLVVVEGARWLHRPRLALSGDPAGPQDPVARSDHGDHRLSVD